jgi:hypothetical protein
MPMPSYGINTERHTGTHCDFIIFFFFFATIGFLKWPPKNTEKELIEDIPDYWVHLRSVESHSLLADFRPDPDDRPD